MIATPFLTANHGLSPASTKRTFITVFHGGSIGTDGGGMVFSYEWQSHFHESSIHSFWQAYQLAD